MTADLFSDLQARGEAAVQELCDEAAEETLHIEFKTIADPALPTLTKDDKKLIGRALCGLANAEGGTLVLGVATRKEDEIDVADHPTPIANVQRLRNAVVAMLPDLLNPQHEGILVHPIQASGDAGFLAVHVPTSDLRPHMSVKHHQYFRRTSDGTRLMEHGEVRDLLLAPREARLRLERRVIQTVSSPNGHCGIGIFFDIANVGRVAARNVFLRVGSLTEVTPECAQTEGVAALSRPNGVTVFSAVLGSILHVGDSQEMMHMKLRLAPILPRRYAPPARDYETVDTSQLRSETRWLIGRHRAGGTVSDNLECLHFRFVYGAENGAIQDEEVRIDRSEITNAISISDHELFNIFNPGPVPIPSKEEE